MITQPRLAVAVRQDLQPPDLRVPNQGRRGEPGPPFFEAYGQWMGTPPPTWEDIAWLREQWGGPFMLKGVMRVDDAKRAVDAGVSAISVSNHGGNNLDGTPASIRACPRSPTRSATRSRFCWTAASAAAATSSRRSRWERGRYDRPRLPVGPGGQRQAGVENVLDILHGGIDSALMGLGKASDPRPQPDDILVPDGFARALGVPDGPRRAER